VGSIAVAYPAGRPRSSAHLHGFTDASFQPAFKPESEGVLDATSAAALASWAAQVPLFFLFTSHEGNLSLPVARGDYLQFHVYCAQQWQAGKYPSSGVITIIPHTTSFEILAT